MLLTPRYYQTEAVKSAWGYIRASSQNPCIVIPTGGGKSLIIAMLINDVLRWNGRVIVLQHVKELIEQNANELRTLLPDVEIGIYSAGLDSRDLNTKVLFAGIQSIYNKAFEFDEAPNIVIIDEAHLIPPKGEGRYRTFLNDLQMANPSARLIGLTATPFRTSSGTICSVENMLHHVCYEANVKDLIEAGYLSRIRSKAEECDTSGLTIRAGEFVAAQAVDLMTELTDRAVKDLINKTDGRKSVLVFGQSVNHCRLIQESLDENGFESVCVFGETPAEQRERELERFKRGRLRFLINMNLLTTGFNARNIDCVVLLRATASPGLYAQMVGRGLRLSPETGKADCLILDYGGNIERHGPIDNVRAPDFRMPGSGPTVVKRCPECSEMVAAAVLHCPECGYDFPPPVETIKITSQAESERDILTEQTVFEVCDVQYSEWKKRNADDDAPRTMRVDYIGESKTVSEWVCVEHSGYPGRKAETWWRRRCLNPMPETAIEASIVARHPLFLKPVSILTEPDGKYTRIVGYRFEPGAEPVEFDYDLNEQETARVEGAGITCEQCGFNPPEDGRGCGADFCPFIGRAIVDGRVISIPF